MQWRLKGIPPRKKAKSDRLFFKISLAQMLSRCWSRWFRLTRADSSFQVCAGTSHPLVVLGPSQVLPAKSGEWWLHPEEVHSIKVLFGMAEVDLFVLETSTHCPIWFSLIEKTRPLGQDDLASGQIVFSMPFPHCPSFCQHCSGCFIWVTFGGPLLASQDLVSQLH